MRTLWVTALVVACATGSHLARADDAHIWDRTYQPQGQGSFPCPQPHQEVVVTDGHFSIAWDLHIGDEFVTIGHIEGTVDASGDVTDAATRFEHFSPKVMQALADDSDSADELRKRPMKVKFGGGTRPHGGVGDRHVTVSFEKGMCSAVWKWSHDDVAAASDSGPVDCNSGSYAVALWSKAHAFKTGDFTRVSKAGQPTRLYRCIDGCKAGDDPLTSHGRQATWALFGECAGAVAAEPALPKSGAAKWDATYSVSSGLSQDWRCPRKLESLVVAKGKFSIPWAVDARGDAGYPVGTIDGVIAADGKVTLRPSITVDSLPASVTSHFETKKTSAAAMTLLRAWDPLTATFEQAAHKTQYDAKGRRGKLVFGDPNACAFDLHAPEFELGERTDGVDCDYGKVWDAKRAYARYDYAVLEVKGVQTSYQCQERDGCKAGNRPDGDSAWSREGHCE
jgi:hypothetical protein